MPTPPVPPFATIADIGKERIRRVIAKLKSKPPNPARVINARREAEDLGFRVFKLQPAPETISAPHDLWEIVLMLGLGLSAQVESRVLPGGNMVYRVSDDLTQRSFGCCLDAELHENFIDELAALGVPERAAVVLRKIAVPNNRLLSLAARFTLRLV